MSDRRTELLDCALTLLAEQGLRGLTHRAVDQVAGLPAGSTSYYFRTRAALVEGCVGRLLELDLAVELPSVLAARPAALVDVLTGIGVAMATAQRRRTLARYELSLAAVREPELRAAADRGGRHAAPARRAGPGRLGGRGPGRGRRRGRRRAGRPGVHGPAAWPARPARARRLAAPGPGPGTRGIRANGPFAPVGSRERPVRANPDGVPDARGAGRAVSVAAMSETSVVWFRRDLRVRDQPTFLAAADAAARALALFVLDPALLDPAGPARRTFLYRSLRDLDASAGREAAGRAG